MFNSGDAKWCNIVQDQDHNIVIAMSSSSRADTDSVQAGGIKMFLSESLTISCS